MLLSISLESKEYARESLHLAKRKAVCGDRRARLPVSDLVISDSVNTSIYQALRSLASDPILDFIFQVKDCSKVG